MLRAVSCAGLLDPRWREQQQKSVEDKKQQEEVYAAGTQIGSNLKYLADYRTDIFGQEETVIGRKVGVRACVRACVHACVMQVCLSVGTSEGGAGTCLLLYV